MHATLRIRRFDPACDDEPRWQDYDVDWEPGTVVLYALHQIHDHQDGTLAYRYSCRGAICGSCAIRINGVAALSCKTQLAELDTDQPVTLEPLLNSDVIKDLVVDQGPFFAALRETYPWLTEGGRDPHEEYTFDESMSKNDLDQFMRSTDCIMCQACFSDCPKRREDPSFIGPAACVEAYKRIYHPQEPNASGRLEEACEPGGIFDCDRHAHCVRVCPKDCRPMRAIMFLQRRAKEEGLGDE
jgi:succinate dehydrogenase / fumarate reductase iron-sulfur subunit